MGKYKTGDGFIIKVLGINNGYRMYETTGGLLLSEECLDGLKKARETLIERANQEAYEKGMWDAWNLAKKICSAEEKGGLSIPVIHDLAIDGDIASIYVVDNDDGKVQEVEVKRLKKVGPSIDVKETLLTECVAATCRHAKELRDSV